MTRADRLAVDVDADGVNVSAGSSASLSVPLLGGVRGGFMVPMRAQSGVEALYEVRVRGTANGSLHGAAYSKPAS